MAKNKSVFFGTPSIFLASSGNHAQSGAPLPHAAVRRGRGGKPVPARLRHYPKNSRQPQESVYYRTIRLLDHAGPRYVRSDWPANNRGASASGLEVESLVLRLRSPLRPGRPERLGGIGLLQHELGWERSRFTQSVSHANNRAVVE